MKLWLIKLGKAWNVLRRDGLLRGGKRIIKAFLGLFKGVQPGDILFISNGVGDSARYRTTHVAEALSHQGFRTAVTVQDNPFLVSYAHDFSVFVFHRVLYTEKVKKLMEHIKEHQKTIIFETDDLVYDPTFLPFMDGYSQMNPLEKKLYERGLGGEIVADPYVKVATTTTSFLAEKLREKGKQVFIVRNNLSKQDLLWAEQALKHHQSSASTQVSSRGESVANHRSSVVRVAYFSGTQSHNKDFATLTPALLRLLKAHPELRLVLAGPLDTDRALGEYEAQIERVPFMNRQELFRKIAEVDINLAPLEVGNPFCEAKSELKWFEAGLLGVPTVAAATQTFREAIKDGEDGFVASTIEEWEAKLKLLIEDKEKREAIGAAARQSVLARYTTKSVSEEYINFLKERV